jgi:hypothetical protein
MLLLLCQTHAPRNTSSPQQLPTLQLASSMKHTPQLLKRKQQPLVEPLQVLGTLLQTSTCVGCCVKSHQAGSWSTS